VDRTDFDLKTGRKEKSFGFGEEATPALEFNEFNQSDDRSNVRNSICCSAQCCPCPQYSQCYFLAEADAEDDDADAGPAGLGLRF